MSVVPARGWTAVRVYLEMIKIEHSIFALPFAMIGMIWGSISMGQSGWPGWSVFGWIVLAMVSCRSAAMAFNRIADRKIDAENPRTVMRALPAGLLQLKQANLFLAISLGLFFLAAAMLNPMTLTLSPVALLFTMGYSLTKRFTWLCHFVLGFSLGIAPSAAWIAVTGSLSAVPLALTAAVTLWTAGFDIIYALQDDDFDRQKGLKSIPSRFGRAAALRISRVSHGLCVLALGLAVYLAQGGLLSWVGVGLAIAVLAYEQSLVKPDDLSRVNMAFFTLNGYLSMGVFLFVLADLWI